MLKEVMNMNTVEQESRVPATTGEVTFSSLVNRPEFRRDPAKAVNVIIDYGLERFRAGVEGVWPSGVSPDLTAGEKKAPELFAAAFRVDGLGIALLALKHAEGLGVSVSSPVKDKVEATIHEFTRDSQRAMQDLATTADLTAEWGHRVVAEALRSKVK
jgi:hypothetical protein